MSRKVILKYGQSDTTDSRFLALTIDLNARLGFGGFELVMIHSHSMHCEDCQDWSLMELRLEYMELKLLSSAIGNRQKGTDHNA